LIDISWDTVSSRECFFHSTIVGIPGHLPHGDTPMTFIRANYGDLGSM